MKKIYVLFLFIGMISFSFTTGIQAQSNTPEIQNPIDVKIDGIRIYPNPVSAGGTLYITSTSGRTKTVKIFSALGKQVLFKVLIGKELDIAHLNPGVYVITITEGEFKTTKKLIVK